MWANAQPDGHPMAAYDVFADLNPPVIPHALFLT